MSFLENAVPALLLVALAACGGGDDSPMCTTCQTDDAEVDAGRPDDAAVDTAPEVDAEVDAGYAWNLPKNFPVPLVPDDNPMTAAKVELGRHLFYDKRLSGNGTQSCATCHDQKLAFTDGRALGLGSTGASHTRGPMSLANVGYGSTLTWSNPLLVRLERQAQVPMFGTDPVELGLVSQNELVANLVEEPRYHSLFAASFPDDADAITALNTTRALASFQRSLISGNAPFDRYSNGDKSAISASAVRGSVMFGQERFECFHCHGNFSFSDQVNHAGQRVMNAAFHNNALYNIDGQGRYPRDNQGLITFTGFAGDMGKFKAPTLRNIAVTAPYMHDGSIATLDEVLDHYAAGGRTITEGPNAGIGFKNRYKSEFIHGFDPPLNAQERADLLAFLQSLTDDEFLTNPAHSDPWVP